MLFVDHIIKERLLNHLLNLRILSQPREHIGQLGALKFPHSQYVFLHYMLFSKLEPKPWPFNHITTISLCVETYFLVKKKTLLVDKYYSTRYWQWVFVGLLIFIHDLVFDSIHPQIFKQCTLTFEWHNPKTFPMHVGCFHQLEKRI